MKKIKIFTALLAITTFVISCSKTDDVQNNDLANKLTEFENRIKGNSLAARATYDLTTITTSRNPYESYGQDVYGLLCSFQDKMEVLVQTTDFETDVKPVVDSMMLSYVGYDPNFSSDEIALRDSYASALSVEEDKIAVSKSYEEFVVANYTDVSQVQNFMKFVGTVKYSTFKVQEKRSFTIREICANDCMRDEFNSWNPIEWVEATVGFLGGGLFWMYGSCWYDCW